MSAYIRLASDAAIATSILPTGEDGKPLASFFQVAPASRVKYTALPGPPLLSTHVFSSTCHIPARSTFGSLLSIARPEHPVFWSAKSDRCQVRPPSVVLKTPRSCCGPVARPSAHTYTTSGVVGC